MLAPIVVAQLTPTDETLIEVFAQSPAYAISIYLLWRDTRVSERHRDERRELFGNLMQIVQANSSSNEKENSRLVAQLSEMMKKAD